MYRSIVKLLLASIVFVLLTTGCKDAIKDFSFSYTMESVNNYKVYFEVSSDKSYVIETTNIYMSKQADEFVGDKKTGTLSDEELDVFREKLSDANLFALKDAYGFDDEEEDPLGYIMYQLHVDTGEKDKSISIKKSDSNVFPKSFVDFFNYINVFINEHK